MTTTHPKRAHYAEHKGKSGPVIVVKKGEVMSEPTDDDGCWEHGMEFVTKRVEPAAHEIMHCDKCDVDVQWRDVPVR